MREESAKKKAKVRRVVKRVAKMVGCAMGGAVLALLLVVILVLNNKPELSVWHTVKLDEEFTDSSKVDTFAEYLELEDRLFAQLEEEVYTHDGDALSINRYRRGSLSDPGRWPQNWNRSYELVPESAAGKPKAAVLLIHGLSDSPYSLRHVAKRLHAEGAYVLGLRVPGHGTAPAALTRTSWKDMAAAVRLAMFHMEKQAHGQPLYVVGYSNGGALAVNYALSSLEDAGLPELAGMALISPEIGVTKAASAAIWQDRAGRWLGLRKLEWTDVHPEYDPFKYSSFTARAGNLAYELTKVNRKKIARLSKVKKLGSFPPVLTFQSAVDSTVSAPAIVRDLFAKLPQNRHVLVVFDINRNPLVESLLSKDPRDGIGLVLDEPNRTFTFSVLTTVSEQREQIVIRTWLPGQSDFVELETPFTWPRHVYSLSHVALPFPSKDPLYGGIDADKSPGIRIGRAVLRGEKGAIQIPASELLRQRWNPFYPYLEQRIVEHFELAGPDRPARRLPQERQE